MYQCPSCLRHKERIKIVKVDKKTKKKWYILTCPSCDYESDIEEYREDKTNKSSSYNPSPFNINPSPQKGFDGDWWEDNDSESLSGD